MSKLNSKIWDSENNIQEDIRQKLLEISKIFLKDIEVPIAVKNIFFTGSLASYQWRPTSDIDLHIIVDVLDENCLDTVPDYFDSKSKIFNKEYDIYIKGYVVEVNLKTKEERLKGKGIYDILNKTWVSFPEKAKLEMENKDVLEMSEKIKMMIDQAIAEKSDIDELKKIRNIIKSLRSEGLSKDGEYSIGNLVFKKLRHDEYIKKLYDYKSTVLNQKLSLENFRSHFSQIA